MLYVRVDRQIQELYDKAVTESLRFTLGKLVEKLWVKLNFHYWIPTITC